MYTCIHGLQDYFNWFTIYYRFFYDLHYLPNERLAYVNQGLLYPGGYRRPWVNSLTFPIAPGDNLDFIHLPPITRTKHYGRYPARGKGHGLTIRRSRHVPAKIRKRTKLVDSVWKCIYSTIGQIHKRINKYMKRVSYYILIYCKYTHKEQCLYVVCIYSYVQYI